MNNVGESFFSSPIDPLDISQRLGPVGRRPAAPAGSQRHDQHAEAPATTAWQHLSHGFQLSGMLQYYSALPFNIISGVANCRARRAVRWPMARRPAELRRAIRRLHPAQCRHGRRLLHAEPAREPEVPSRVRVKADVLVEAFNVDKRRERLDSERDLGPRPLSVESGGGIRSGHRGWRSAHRPIRRSPDVLNTRRDHRRRIASEKKPAALATCARARSAPTGRPATPCVLKGQVSRLP